MDPEAREPRATCVNCGAALTGDPCGRCGRPRSLPSEYLHRIEGLARKAVEEAVRENSFNLYSDAASGKTDLQAAIGKIARELLYWHYAGDGCLGHGEDQDAEAPAKDPVELRSALLAAIERMDDEVFRKNWGYDLPSPGKLIREGLRIARQSVEGVPLGEPDYLGAVQKALMRAREKQESCGISDDGWRDEDGYIGSGIMSVYREAEKLRASKS